MQQSLHAGQAAQHGKAPDVQQKSLVFVRPAQQALGRQGNAARRQGLIPAGVQQAHSKVSLGRGKIGHGRRERFQLRAHQHGQIGSLHLILVLLL